MGISRCSYNERVEQVLGVSHVTAGYLIYRMKAEGLIENKGWQVCVKKRLSMPSKNINKPNRIDDENGASAEGSK